MTEKLWTFLFSFPVGIPPRILKDNSDLMCQSQSFSKHTPFSIIAYSYFTVSWTTMSQIILTYFDDQSYCHLDTWEDGSTIEELPQ